MVYVLDKNGHPLMPTERYGKVRRLLKSGKAKVIKRCPFTIQLMYDSTTHTQDVSLGVDAGSKFIGISATTEKKVLYESVVELRSDIVKLLSTRRELRRGRRYRNTRYRQPRFDNRVHSKNKGWLAPSVEQKISTHLKVIEDVCKILPVTRITIETASFDIQKIKNPDISGTDYQQGEQLNFWNVREYVLWRDNHTCQCCSGKSGDKILNVHHKESRQTGGDSPDNLVTLCETCHHDHHTGKIALPESVTRRGQSFRNAAFMGIMRWTVYNRLKKMYPDVHMTYGYITKNTRITNNLPKEHYMDARCISGNPQAVSDGSYFCQKKIRCHNRQIHKAKFSKGHIRKLNQCAYEVKGFRLFDKVKSKGSEWYIHGKRTKGAFVLKNLSGDTLEISPSKIQLICYQRGFIAERRIQGFA